MSISAAKVVRSADVGQTPCTVHALQDNMGDTGIDIAVLYILKLVVPTLKKHTHFHTG